MADEKPHKAEFLSIVGEDPNAVHFLMGYLAGEIPDEMLAKAVQSWRSHVAALADLERQPDGTTRTEFYDPRD